MLTRCHLILYVKDQDSSTTFYATVLQKQPDLHVQGMTEFTLSVNTVLGLMPETNIVQLLGKNLPDPSTAQGIPRAEIYLVVDDPQSFYARAIKAGAQPISDLAMRDWGDEVAYCLDLDGHVLAFAR